MPPPTRRRFSLKRTQLEAAYGRPWQEIALEFERKPLTLEQIGMEWAVVVSRQFPGATYSAQVVSDTIRAAKAEQIPALA